MPISWIVALAILAGILIQLAKSKVVLIGFWIAFPLNLLIRLGYSALGKGNPDEPANTISLVCLAISVVVDLFLRIRRWRSKG